MAKKIGVTMEVGNDGVVVITISNPPVNSLASPSILKSSILFDHSRPDFFVWDSSVISGLKEKFQDANQKSAFKAIVLTVLRMELDVQQFLQSPE
ncbi:unnamed protein product [Brassica napus]|uniref:(rape) hypothetical protein n=1 Tax=Brassica napus TaxID=3708 RepID=A0A816MDQ8_BRANA|nr:unnamed protein product [Brassica napus]